jgi:sec-independent protein translocase protein TatB
VSFNGVLLQNDRIGFYMFGMGFMEILLIAIIAVIALGPEKLPGAMVEMAKMFKKFKSGVDEAKSTFDSEINITEMRSEADKLKASLSYSQEFINTGINDIMNDDEKKVEVSSKEEKSEEPKKASKKEKVSFNKDKEA